MKRQVDRLVEQSFDLVVVGAGIVGTCIARDAALRGLRVALIDRGDLGGATSHNSLRTLHGGFRYLRQLDVRRLRESAAEQRYWRWAAGDLVRPVDFVLPSSSAVRSHALLVRTAHFMYRLLATGAGRRVPDTAMDATQQPVATTRRTFPGAGFRWSELQLLDPDRLLLGCARQAVAHGAVVVNHLQALALLRHGRRVVGVACRDAIDGRELEVRGDLTINACGPYAFHWLEQNGIEQASSLPLSRCVNVVVRDVGVDEAFAFPAADGSRLYFAAPWRDCTLIGTANERYLGDPATIRLDETGLRRLLADFNVHWPLRPLRVDDVLYQQAGLMPADGGDGHAVRLADRARIVDHRQAHDLPGLVTVVGEKYTTARALAERVVDLSLRALGSRARPCPLAAMRVPEPDGPGLGDVPGDDAASTFRQRCLWAVDHEMPMGLDDLLLRRTDLAIRGRLSPTMLRWAATTMGARLGWSSARREREITRMTALVPGLSGGALVDAAG